MMPKLSFLFSFVLDGCMKKKGCTDESTVSLGTLSETESFEFFDEGRVDVTGI